MKSEPIEIIRIQSNFINDLQRVASEALVIYSNEGEVFPETKCFLDFSWLAKKFRALWFENIQTAEFISSRIPELRFFTPVDFEYLVQSVLWLVEDKFYQTTPITNDGGVDLFHDENHHVHEYDFEITVRTVVQCKLYRGYVPVSEIRDFFGVMTSQTASGIFLTTGKLTAQAKEFLNATNSSPHSNRLFFLERKQWDQLLSLAEEIFRLIEDSQHVDNEEILCIAQRITKLKTDAKKILYCSKIAPDQKTLF